MYFDETKHYHRKELPNEKFLRSSSITIGDQTNYDAQPVGEYKDKYRAFQLERHLSAKEREAVGVTLRQTNFSLGDDRSTFSTTTGTAYTKPTPGQSFKPTINTKELQRSHICLGDLDSDTYDAVVREGFQSTNRADYDAKPVSRAPAQTKEMIHQLRAAHWSVGDTSAPVPPSHFESTTKGAFTAHPEAGPSHLSEAARADLRRSHITFGGGPANSDEPVGRSRAAAARDAATREAVLREMGEGTGGATGHSGVGAEESPFSSSQRLDFQPPDQTLVERMPNAGTATGILPTKVDASTKQILRAHHYSLGDDKREFSTTYGSAYVRMPLDPDVWEQLD